MRDESILRKTIGIFLFSLIILTILKIDELITFKTFVEVFFISLIFSLLLVGLVNKKMNVILIGLFTTQIFFLVDSVFKFLFTYNNSFVSGAIQFSLVLLFICSSLISYRLCKETDAFEELKIKK